MYVIIYVVAYVARYDKANLSSWNLELELLQLPKIPV